VQLLILPPAAWAGCSPRNLTLATNFRGYSSPDGTWAVLLDRRDHALGLLSGGASADGVEEVERFRCLWNLECPPASEMLAEAEARFAAERSSRK
jgi:hypothetical protein